MIKIRRISSTAEPKAKPEAATRDAFASYLLAFRNRFAADAKVELALMSLAPVAREKLDGLWQGSCALRMVGPRSGGGKGELMAKIEFDMAHIPDVDVIEKASGW